MLLDERIWRKCSSITISNYAMVSSLKKLTSCSNSFWKKPKAKHCLAKNPGVRVCIIRSIILRQYFFTLPLLFIVNSQFLTKELWSSQNFQQFLKCNVYYRFHSKLRRFPTAENFTLQTEYQIFGITIIKIRMNNFLSVSENHTK